MKLINLKGNDYAPVDERLRAFHKQYPNSSIQTKIEFKDKFVVAYATVTPDVEKPNRIFNGSSFGMIDKEKAFEKLETVAVGRALAFAGFLADGKIASFEEMEKFFEGEDQEVSLNNQPSLNQKTNLVETISGNMKVCPKCNSEHNGKYPKCFNCFLAEKNGTTISKKQVEATVEATNEIKMEDVYPF